MSAVQTEVKSRPIIFGADSVRAIHSGRKTQTRRVIKNPDKYEHIRECGFCCPYGKVGERLWVREAAAYSVPTAIIYRADLSDEDAALWKFRSPIFMPRWASRITLEITNVRVERLQDITDADAVAEGCEDPTCESVSVAAGFMRDIYRGCWDYLNEKRGFGWETNPWVFVIEFKRV